MAARNARHFARLLSSPGCARLESAFTASTSSRLFQSSTAAGAPSNPVVGLPTLANVPVKLNNAKWAAPRAVDAAAMSIFDIKGAISVLSKPPEPTTVTAGMAALRARVARAQQQSATIAGFRLFPDLTPGRAFMWGTILAVWSVALTATIACRAMDIHSVKDVPVKMKEHLAPVVEWGKASFSSIPETFTIKDSQAISDVHVFASTLKRNLRGDDEQSSAEWNSAS